MRLPYLPSLLLVVTILPVIIAEPDVFGDYFDDGMKLVDISQDAALRSCLSNGNTADKTKAAYDECYGQGYDFDDLAKAGGDDDGLPEELEEKESCFYKKMGWVSEDNVMDEAAIAADMEGLENQIQEQFNNDVGTCVAWSGNFGERRKREAGMEVQGETQDSEVIPGLMDTGRRAMGWVRKLVRKVRSPANGQSGKEKKPNKKSGKCKGKGPGCKRRRAKKKSPSKKKSPGKTGRRKALKRRSGKGNGGASRPGRNGGKGPKRKGRRGQGRARKRGKKGKKEPKEKEGKGSGKRRSRSRNNSKKKGGKKDKKPKEDSKGRRQEKNKRKKNCKGKKCGNRKKFRKENDNKEIKPQRKNDRSLPEAVYNKLWCIDLAIEQALEKCVEAKIQN